MPDDICPQIDSAEMAYQRLTAMVAENPMKDYPTGYVYPEEVREAAGVLWAEVQTLRA